MRAAGSDRSGRQPRRAIATGVAVAFLLAGCSGEGEGSDGGQDGDGGSTALRMAIGAEPRTLDILTAEDGQTTTFQFNVYEAMTFRDSATMELEPKLAETWEVDGNVWTFQLREGVTFHDGTDLTAEDVAASFERLMLPDSEIGGSRAGGVVDVRATGDLSVEIETEGPDPTLPAKVSLVAIAPAELADPANDEIGTTMVGTGPYEFLTWDRGQEITLEASDSYWGEAPSLQDVTLTFLEEDSTRMASLRAGEIDIALKMPSEFASQAPKVVTAASPDVYTLFFNTENGVFSDVRLRRAAALAIDRQAIIDNLLGGEGEQVKGQFVGQYVFGSTTELEELPFDVEEARSLVAEAGGGEIVLSSPTGRWLKDREIAQAIGGMLEEVGFTVTVELPELGAWLESLTAEDSTGGPDVWLAGHGNDIFDMDRSVAWLSCGESLSHYCNEEVLALAQQARQELDVDRRQDLYTQMWQLAQEDVPYASISTIDQLHLTGEDVEWQPRADGFVMFEDITVG